MPAIQMGAHHESRQPTDFSKVQHNYDYPLALDLRPGSPLHELLKTRIMQRARASHDVMKNRFDSWNRVDETLTAYIPLDAAEQVVKKSDHRKPVSIIFPYSYAVMETVLTYMVMAFFQDPIFRYEGRSPEDTIGGILLEKVVQYQCQKTKVELGIHTMLRDAIAYGLGPVVPTWITQRGRTPVRLPDQEVSFEEGLVFEGNGLSNIDPYLYLPDPSVPSHRLQDGEFVGWIDRTNYMKLKADERLDEDMFNVRYLETMKGRRSFLLNTDQSARNTKSGGSSSNRASLMEGITNPVDVINMYVRLVPKDWKLGDGDDPEWWFFGLAADEVIIEARRADLNHQMAPVVCCSPEFDGYSATPLSRIEILYGLQHTLDWLFNSHVANVRKALHDMLIVDPFLINMNDLSKPGPGKLIRLRRPAWGRGVENAVKQLDIHDVTRGNIQDSMFLVQWMQKIGGTDDSVMGSLRQGGPERLTSSEFQGTRQGAVGRLERVARVIGIQAMQDIATMFGYHTQQNMEIETFVKITGEWEADLAREFHLQPGSKLAVTPYDLSIAFDVIPRDGSVPGSNFSESWMQLFESIANHPELQQEFSVVRVFKHIARNLGAKNVNEFVRKGGEILPQVRPDEEVLREAERGNVVPVGGGY